MSARIFVDGQRADAIPDDDRGLAYGDGLFETMRVHRGEVPWWDVHWTRLAHGAGRLRIALPDQRQVRTEVADLCDADVDTDAGNPGSVLKLLLTRGSGGRGYAPPSDAMPTWKLSLHPLPGAMPVHGLQVQWCETRLASQPLLAGLKHCNRLEQVLARAECQTAGTDEGLVCDHDDNAIGATSANLFVLHQGRWLTPRLDRCGVAGICRSQLMQPLNAYEARLDRAMVNAADAVFLCNAVRGILPVATLDGRQWPPHPAVAAARCALARLHPGFVVAPGQGASDKDASNHDGSSHDASNQTRKPA